MESAGFRGSTSAAPRASTTSATLMAFGSAGTRNRTAMTTTRQALVVTNPRRGFERKLALAFLFKAPEQGKTFGQKHRVSEKERPRQTDVLFHLEVWSSQLHWRKWAISHLQVQGLYLFLPWSTN